jgi:hypothetical protein
MAYTVEHVEAKLRNKLLDAQLNMQWDFICTVVRIQWIAPKINCI